MRFGVMLPHFLDLASPENIRVVARAAEDLGFDSVWTTDHVAIVEQLQPRFGTTVYEATSVLAYLAAMTSRVRLGISALILPYRNPVITAKVLAGIDALSDGRLIVAATSGWCKEEFEALGVPFEQRGDLSDEALRVILELWTSEHPSFASPRYRFRDLAFQPKPVQFASGGHMPLWIGGNSARGMQRALEFGSAWHLAPPSVAEVTHARQELTAALRQAGRSPDEVEITIRLPLLVLEPAEAERSAPPAAGRHPRAELRDQQFVGDELEQVSLIGTAEAIASRLRRHAEAGATYVVFDLFYSLPQLRGQSVEAILTTMRRFTEQVRPLL